MERGEGGTVYGFGGLPALAPTAKRVDVMDWLAASATMGALAGAAALALAWRPFLGLDAPPGALADHAGHAARWAINALCPRVFELDAARYADFLDRLGAEQKFALGWRACVAGLVACAPSIFLAPGMLMPRDGLTVLRGARRTEGRDATRSLNALLAKRCRARPDHPVAPGVPYPADLWTRHMLVLGSVGSGKSTAIKPLIAKVVAAGERALIFDPKGEFTKGFGEPAILAPWDSRSVAWVIAKDMRNIGDMRRFAAAMVREAHDPMWSNAARQLLVGFMVYLKSTRGDDWGWAELSDLSASPQATILPMMSAYHPEAARSVERASVTTQGILINLASFMASIHDLGDAWGGTPRSRRVSFVDWTHGRGPHRQIILQGHGAYPDLAKSCLEGIIGTVSAIVNSVEMDDDPDRKIWIIADESAQMGKVPIRPLFDVGRSRGVRCVLACQDLGQLEEIHGAATVKAMVSMAGTILVGQLMPGETSEQMCKALGSREVERANVSSSTGGGPGAGRSTTLSFSRDELALYKPSELASRLGPTADGKGVRMALVTGGHSYEIFWPHFSMRDARPAHVPAAWTCRFVAPAAGMGASADCMGISGADAVNAPAPAADDLDASRSEAGRPAGTFSDPGVDLQGEDVLGDDVDDASRLNEAAPWGVERPDGSCPSSSEGMPAAIEWKVWAHEEIQAMLRDSAEIVGDT
ncbi:type IV secretion system DNA-binding domain-containing protein [Massilia violaceinigra]|nr:type IV secretion system DNA-binding domain-containing protein [Massilia violaceinigra]